MLTDLLQSFGPDSGTLLFVADVAIRTALLVAIAWCICRALGALSARLRSATWSAAILGSLAMPLLVAFSPRMELPLLPSQDRATQPSGALLVRDAPATAHARDGVRGLASVLFAEHPEAHRCEQAGATLCAAHGGDHGSGGHLPPAMIDQPGGSLALLLGAFWGFVALVLLARLGASWIVVNAIVLRASECASERVLRHTARALRRTGIRRTACVRVTNAVDRPMTFGFVRPIILLPRGADSWDASRLRVALEHECTHITRGDWLLRLAAGVACALHWFNPLVWFAARRLDLESERACDEAVVGMGTRASDYASHLVATAMALRKRTCAPALGVAMARESTLEKRLMSILDRRCRIGGSAPLAFFLSASLIVAASFIGACEVTPKEPDNASRQADEPRLVAASEPDGAQAFEEMGDASPQDPFDTFRADRRERMAGAQDLEPDDDWVADADEDDRADGADAHDDGEGLGESHSFSFSQDDWGWDEDFDLTGEWSARRRGGKTQLRIEVDEPDWHMQTTVTLNGDEQRSLSGALDGNDGLEGYSLVRDAGSFVLAGTARNGRAGGTFTFEPNEAFVVHCEGLGAEGLSRRELLLLAMQDVTREDLDAYGELALDGFDAETLIELVIFGVEPAFIRELRQCGFVTSDSGDYVQLRIHGVKPKFACTMQEVFGDELDIDGLVQLAIHGVKPRFVQELGEMGFADLDIDDAVQMSIHGVNTRYLRQLSDIGFADLDTDTVIQLSIHGVNAKYAKQLFDAGLEDLDTDDLVQLSIHGVDPEYVASLQELGVGEVDVEDLVRLSNHGVHPKFVRQMGELGYEDIGVDELVHLSIHGIDAKYVKGIRDAGFEHLDLDDMTQFAIHGVSVRSVQELHEAGFTELSADDIIQLQIHGVRSEYLRASRAYFGEGIDIHDLVQIAMMGVDAEYFDQLIDAGAVGYGPYEVVQLWNHGVRASWIRGMRENGLADLDPNELVQLHNHGITPKFMERVREQGFDTSDPDELIKLYVTGRVPH